MIRIVLGNVGSGKTAMIVREMLLNKEMKYYSNIITRKIKNNIPFNNEMLIQKDLVKTKKDGTPVYDKKLNVGYWKSEQENNDNMNVIIDEAHTVMNSRNAMTKTNKIMGDFLALLRRVLGSSDDNAGELILISQLERRLDVIAKEMATKVQFCICHYLKECKKCGIGFPETNETPDKIKRCPNCNSKLKRKNFIIEVLNFINMDAYQMYHLYGMKSYYDRFFITDIEDIFPLYDTLQWDNLITED